MLFITRSQFIPRSRSPRCPQVQQPQAWLPKHMDIASLHRKCYRLVKSCLNDNLIRIKVNSMGSPFIIPPKYA
eukprot:7208527-Ditylum_brightwellii.AAC.1